MESGRATCAPDMSSSPSPPPHGCIMSRSSSPHFELPPGLQTGMQAVASAGGAALLAVERFSNNYLSIGRADPLLRALDAVRLRYLRALGPLARTLMPARALRVSLGFCLAICTSLALTFLFPLWLMALGPLILGVPHLLADLRYLVIRPGLHRRPLLWAVCGVPILAGGLNLGVSVGLFATLGALLAAQAHSAGARFVRSVGIPLTLVLMGLASRWPEEARLLLAHAHNFIAVAVWWFWRPYRPLWHAIPVVFFGFSCALILSGTLEPWLVSSGVWSWVPPGITLSRQLASLVPAGWQEDWGIRLVLLFAFTQSIHYAVWLRLMPEEDRQRPTPRTFRASAQALQGDFGTFPLLVVAVLCVGFLGASFLDLTRAREGYFGLALFHGYLELAAVAFLWIEGRLGDTVRLEPREMSSEANPPAAAGGTP